MCLFLNIPNIHVSGSTQGFVYVCVKKEISEEGTGMSGYQIRYFNPAYFMHLSNIC